MLNKGRCLSATILTIVLTIASSEKSSSLATASGSIEDCGTQCRGSYGESEGLLQGCNSGCRLMNIVDAMFFGFERDSTESLNDCNRNCNLSFGVDANQVDSCHKGCAFMLPIVEAKHQMQYKNDPFENILHRSSVFDVFNVPSWLSPSGQRQREEVDRADERRVPQSNGFGDLGKTINGLLNWSLDFMKSRVPNMQEGKLVVIQKGPGFEKTRVYDLAGQNEPIMDDMMNKENPLETNNEPEDFGNNIFRDFFDKVESKNVDNEVPNLSDVEIFNPVSLNSDNHYIPGPILPESGLKTRYISGRGICIGNREDLRWSEWMSCLHHRMSMSRWLTAAVITSGIALALFLCLSVPQMASKRRVIQQQMNKQLVGKAALAKSKEAEANATVISFVAYKDGQQIDLPPSYDDLKGLRVSVVSLPEEKTEGGEKEAGPLPEKVDLSKDETKA